MLSQARDTHNYMHENNVNARKAVLQAMDDQLLSYPRRHFHPDEKRFTWISTTTPKKYAHLDFFLVSNTLMPYISNTKISPGIQSDHSIISISIDFNRFHRGRGFWKLNSSFLKESEYIDQVKSVIKCTVKEYCGIEYSDQDFNELSAEQIQGLPLTINPQLFF